MIIFLLLLVLAVFLEGSVTTLPFSLILLIVFYCVSKKQETFLIGFIFGLLRDIVDLRLLGVSSLFFVTAIFVAGLYERKFEIQSAPFVFLFSFLGSFLYLLLFGYQNVFPQALVLSLIGVFAFIFANRLQKTSAA